MSKFSKLRFAYIFGIDLATAVFSSSMYLDRYIKGTVLWTWKTNTKTN